MIGERGNCAVIKIRLTGLSQFLISLTITPAASIERADHLWWTTASDGGSSIATLWPFQCAKKTALNSDKSTNLPISVSIWSVFSQRGSQFYNFGFCVFVWCFARWSEIWQWLTIVNKPLRFVFSLLIMLNELTRKWIPIISQTRVCFGRSS